MKATHSTRLMFVPTAAALLLSAITGCGNKPETTTTNVPRSQMATPSSGPGGQAAPVGAYAGAPEAERYRKLVGPNTKPPGSR